MADSRWPPHWRYQIPETPQLRATLAQLYSERARATAAVLLMVALERLRADAPGASHAWRLACRAESRAGEYASLAADCRRELLEAELGGPARVSVEGFRARHARRRQALLAYRSQREVKS